MKEGSASTSDNAVVALAGEPGPEVPVETLDATCDALDLERLDTVKIDVEDWSSARSSAFLPIVYGEFNNQLMPRRGKTFRDVWGVLRAAGLSVLLVRRPTRPDEKPDPPANLGNVVLVPGRRWRGWRAAAFGG